MELQALDPVTRSAVAVRLAGGGARPYAQDGAEDWLAGIEGPPRFTAALGYAEAGWTGGAIPTASTIAWGPADPAGLSRLARLFFVDRRITVRVDDETPNDHTLALLGKVAKQEVSGGRLVLTLADLSGDLAKPLATGTFAGTGGLEGDASVKARIKRRSWGRSFDVEGRVLIAADDIYEFGDPARPLRSMPTVRDKGRGALAAQVAVIDWQGSADATLAALRASVPARGGCTTAPSIACVKWWTQPSGPLTADLHGEGGDGYAETPAGIAALVIAGASTLRLADVPAAVALRPYAAGIHCDDATETAAAVLDRLLGGVSLLWVVEPAGTVRVREWAWTPTSPHWTEGGVALAWAAAGAAPIAWTPTPGLVAPQRSAHVTRKQVFRPTTTRRVGFQRNHRIHTDAEISAAVLADDVLYPDGASVAAMQPREAGADITATNQHVLVVPGAITAAADYLGAILPGQLPATRSFRRLLGQQDVSADTAWTVTAPAGITATIDDTPGDDERGSITVTDARLPGGALRVGSTHGGVTLYAELDFIRADAAASQSTGTGTGTGSGTAGNGTAGGPATSSANASPGQSTDWVPITPAMTAQVGSSGKVTLQYQLGYTAMRGQEDGDATSMLARVVQVAADGTATPVGDTATGSPAVTYFSSEPPKGVTTQSGSVASAVTLTGLAAGPATFQVQGSSDGGGTGIAAVTGSASVTPL